MTKKEAQKNASRDFVNFLVRSGDVAANDVPVDVQVKPENEEQPAGDLQSQEQQNRPVFQVYFLHYV